eukprot:2306292-Pleurochrysis_carterae.AAC.1
MLLDDDVQNVKAECCTCHVSCSGSDVSRPMSEPTLLTSLHAPTTRQFRQDADTSASRVPARLRSFLTPPHREMYAF